MDILFIACVFFSLYTSVLSFLLSNLKKIKNCFSSYLSLHVYLVCMPFTWFHSFISIHETNFFFFYLEQKYELGNLAFSSFH